MVSSISPYALLLACKPKESHGIVNEYDLFSTIQSSSRAPSDSDQHLTYKPQGIGTENSNSGQMSIQNQRTRTHYISGINARHDKARSHV